MAHTRTVYTDVEVEIDLEDFDTDDLLDELDRRGADYNDRFVDADSMRALLIEIWQQRRIGKDYQSQLDQLIYGVLGKVV